jgi:dynein intermediate chain 2
MLDISYHYKTKRTDFGRPWNILEDTTPRLVVQIDPVPDLRAKYENINPFSLGVQAAVSYSQHSVNTEVTQTKLEDVIHREGGWPQGIDPTNAPSCKQTRLKLEKRDNFIPKLKELAAIVDKTAKLNVALDLYSPDFPATEAAIDVADPQIRTISIFRDRYTQRYVSSISWSAESSSVKKVALCCTPREMSSPTAHYESFIYNLECPSVPELELHPHSALLCLEYNNKDNNFLVGGMQHGSLSLWDVRQGSLPVWTSAIDSSHRDAVYAAKWISSKTAFECVSVSADGLSMTWDTRSNTAPIEVVQLNPSPDQLPEGFQPPFGGRCLDYHSGVPTKYMVGTVEGLVMTVNRKAADPNNRISSVFPGHYGPVYAVRRHPTDTKYFCSISDWCCRFFTEDNKTPLVTIPAQRYYLTNAVWGCARTTVVYTANIQGTIDAWDLIQSLKEPICSISVGHCPVYSMAAEPGGQFLLTGDGDGTATLLELNDPLRNISQAERSLFNGMMGREAKRVKAYDQFLKEQKQREKKTTSGGDDEGAKKEPRQFDPAEIEAEFERALRGEAEQVQEKKRIVIGGDEEQQLPDVVQVAAEEAAAPIGADGPPQEGKPFDAAADVAAPVDSHEPHQEGKLGDVIAGGIQPDGPANEEPQVGQEPAAGEQAAADEPVTADEPVAADEPAAADEQAVEDEDDAAKVGGGPGHLLQGADDLTPVSQEPEGEGSGLGDVMADAIGSSQIGDQDPPTESPGLGDVIGSVFGSEPAAADEGAPGLDILGNALGKADGGTADGEGNEGTLAGALGRALDI